MMREYWDSVANSFSQPPKYSRFGFIVAPYWKLERKLALKMALSYLRPASRNGKLLLLKSDLWNEGIDHISGDIFDFLGKRESTVEVVGIDVSQVICDSARRRKHNGELMIACADVGKLPFGDEVFDIIFDVSALDHIPPSHIPSVINELHRALKVGGILALIFDSVTFWWCNPLRKAFNRLRYKETSEFKFWWRLSPEWIEGKLRANGFAILNGIPLGILSLSPLFLHVWQSSPVEKVAAKPSCDSTKSVTFSKALRYLLPFSSQYLYVSRKP